MFSDIGTWVQLVVVGSLVARESGSALKTGLVAMATIMPPGLCAPIGGLFADRMDRRKVFITGLACQGVMTGVLALVIASGVRSPFVLSGIILCSSAVGSLANPAYSAMLPDLVPPGELMAMVALGVYSWNGGRIVGPLLATAVGAAVGPTWTVAFNAVTFVGMAIAVSTVKGSFMPPAHGDDSGVRTRLHQGWVALRRVPGLRASMALVILLNVAIAAFMGLIPIYAREVHDGGTRLAGLLSSVQGAGAITGSLGITALAGQLRRSTLMYILFPVLLVSYLAYALAPTSGAALVAVAGLGFGASGLFVAAMSVGQRDAPEAERGRVLSLIQAAMGGSYGIGILWIAAIGDTVNLRVAFVAASVVMTVGVLLMARASPGWRHVLDGDVAQRGHDVEPGVPLAADHGS